VCGDTYCSTSGIPRARHSWSKRATWSIAVADPGIAGRALGRSRLVIVWTRVRPHRPAALVEQLTDRELAVLRYLPTQLSQREIANELYVSLNTVKTHCSAIYRKLGVSDRKTAVQAARDLRLL
jgi:LuxR family transcriptional regulator, maltose regulon positive regulatory protein